MALDPSIIMSGLRNQNVGEDIMQGMQFGQQMAAQRQQMQLQRQAMEDAERKQQEQATLAGVLARAGGDRQAALRELRLRSMGDVAQSQEMAWGKYDLEQAKTKKETLKADLEARMAQAERNSREAGAVLALHQQGKPDAAQALYQTQARQRMQEGEDLSMIPPTYNPDMLFGVIRQGVAATDQLRQAWEQEKFERGEKAKREESLSPVAKLNADLKAGRITQDQFNAAYKDATTKGPMVQVGFSQPFEVTDPNSGKPVLVQQDKQGNLRQVAGYSPKANERPPTEGQANALGFGMRAMEADRLITALENKGETGGGLGDRFLDVVPGGNYLKNAMSQQVEQGKLNFITATLRKESGAAIGKDEYINEDKKYFAQPGDSPEVIKQKQAARQLAIDVLKTQAGRDLPAPSQGSFTPKRAITAEDQVKMDKLKAAGASGAKIATLKQVRATAERYGKTEMEVIRDLKAQGYTVK